MFKKIDIYIIKKFLGTFFYAIILLAMIIIIFDISEKIDDYIKKGAPLKEIIFSHYVNFLPYFINMFIAFFAFISVIYFTSRLAANTEIISILSSGISFNRFLRPYIISAVLLALLSFFLSNFIIPRTNIPMVAFEDKYINAPRRNSNRNIHRFLNKDTKIYVESYNATRKIGRKFTLEQFKDNRLVYKLKSNHIQWNDELEKWTMKNYYAREYTETGEHITKGRRIDTTLNLHPSEFVIRKEDIRIMDYWQLKKYIKSEKIRGADNYRTFEIEQHKRLAYPFATIILSIIGVSVSSRKKQGGIGFNLGFGVAIAFTYLLFMQFSTVFGESGNLPVYVAAWIPNIIFGAIAYFMLRIAHK